MNNNCFGYTNQVNLRHTTTHRLRTTGLVDSFFENIDVPDSKFVQAVTSFSVIKIFILIIIIVFKI